MNEAIRAGIPIPADWVFSLEDTANESAGVHALHFGKNESARATGGIRGTDG